MNQDNVVWWIRRDLRIKNNSALRKALETGKPVIPVFIIDPAFDSSSDTPRQRFLFQGLDALNTSLHALGSYLVLKTGQPKEVFTNLKQEMTISQVFAEEDYTPYAQTRDAEIAEIIALKLVGGLTLQHPALLSTQKGNPYTVFTPFKKAWQQLPWQPSQDWYPNHPLNTPPDIPGEKLPIDNGPYKFTPGEAAAEAQLHQFLMEGISSYHQERDRLDLEGSSKLSPYLKTGQIAILSVWNAINATFKPPSPNNQGQGVDTWKNELIWREFYQYVLYHFPAVKEHAFKAELRDVKWNEPGIKFEAWKQGLTGFPIIDAAMRQLLSSGWMHNRARMITASFLTKDLLINWQEGEAWFMHNLVDGDIAANNGGWQWSAGVGTDAAPYFRIFNPIIQSKKFDPFGNYIRMWVPELKNVSDQFIHEPWLMPEDMQVRINVRIGKQYPTRIVDRAIARQQTLQAYKSAKVDSSQVQN